MRMPESHPTSAELSAFTLGALDDAAHAAVEAHLAGCPACQERAARESGDSLVALLRRAHARGDEPAIAPDWTASDTMTTPRGTGLAAWAALLRRRWLVVVVAVLLLAALVIGLALGLRRFQAD